MAITKPTQPGRPRSKACWPRNTALAFLALVGVVLLGTAIVQDTRTGRLLSSAGGGTAGGSLKSDHMDLHRRSMQDLFSAAQDDPNTAAAMNDDTPLLPWAEADLQPVPDYTLRQSAAQDPTPGIYGAYDTRQGLPGYGSYTPRQGLPGYGSYTTRQGLPGYGAY